MGLDLNYSNGQTPLDEDEKDGLLIPTIATRAELDEFEQQNIEEAVQWSLGISPKPELIFTESFVRMVHKRMYGNVWKWAGEFRKTNKNIGVDKWQIPTELKNLLDDAKYWHHHNSYDPDEFAIRFKHRIVTIHCFPNGNGRHSRLMADILLQKLFKRNEFSWGAAIQQSDPASRENYLKSLKAADKGDISMLLSFARS
jgi:Fic-DOC domain mobile mystery protein B